jgi:hypothetical protein
MWRTVPRELTSRTAQMPLAPGSQLEPAVPTLHSAVARAKAYRAPRRCSCDLADRGMRRRWQHAVGTVRCHTDSCGDARTGPGLSLVDRPVADLRQHGVPESRKWKRAELGQLLRFLHHLDAESRIIQRSIRHARWRLELGSILHGVGNVDRRTCDVGPQCRAGAARRKFPELASPVSVALVRDRLRR